MSRHLVLTALAVLGLAVAGCGGDSTTTPVTDATVASVELTPAATSVAVGRTLALAATPRAANGAVLPERSIVWSVEPGNVATVSTTGVVTGIALGTATVTATVEGKSARRTITVHATAVESVEVVPGTGTLRAGDTLRLVARPRDNQGAILTDRAVAWQSSAPAIASIDDTGLITARTAGTVTFTATSETKQGVATFTVLAASVVRVTVNTALDTLEAFDLHSMTATLKDSLGNVLADRTIRWTSSDPAIATIDSITGLLTGVQRGTVTVTATVEGKSATATRVVVIKYHSLATGAAHACNIASGGVVWCWGLNGFEGRIGSPFLFAGSYDAMPRKLNTTVRFAQISTYGKTTCGVSLEGRGYCWGSNYANALGDGTYVSESIIPRLIEGGHYFTQVSVGSMHACGVTLEGRLWCWGANSDGQLATGNRSWTTTPVPSAPNLYFESVTTGTDFTCGVTFTGRGYCWGYSGMGNLGDGQPPSLGNTSIITPTEIVGGHRFASLSASNQLTCGVTTDGQGLCWGRGDGMRLGSDVSVPSSTPSPVSGGHIFRSISAGATAVCGVRTDETPWCWGQNSHGQLGQQLANGSPTPIRVGSLLRVAEVSSAHVGGGTGAFTCAISPDRMTTVCWGKNDVGQLGNQTTTSSTAVNAIPTIVYGQRPAPPTP